MEKVENYSRYLHIYGLRPILRYLLTIYANLPHNQTFSANQILGLIILTVCSALLMTTSAQLSYVFGGIYFCYYAKLVPLCVGQTDKIENTLMEIYDKIVSLCWAALLIILIISFQWTFGSVIKLLLFKKLVIDTYLLGRTENAVLQGLIVMGFLNLDILGIGSLLVAISLASVYETLKAATSNKEEVTENGADENVSKAPNSLLSQVCRIDLATLMAGISISILHRYFNMSNLLLLQIPLLAISILKKKANTFENKLGVVVSSMILGSYLFPNLINITFCIVHFGSVIFVLFVERLFLFSALKRIMFLVSMVTVLFVFLVSGFPLRVSLSYLFTGTSFVGYSFAYVYYQKLLRMIYGCERKDLLVCICDCFGIRFKESGDDLTPAKSSEEIIEETNARCDAAYDALNELCEYYAIVYGNEEISDRVLTGPVDLYVNAFLQWLQYALFLITFYHKNDSVKEYFNEKVQQL